MQKIFLLLILFLFDCHRNYAQISVIHNNRSNFSIVLSSNASAAEKKASGILQQYLLKASNVNIQITTKLGVNNVYIGTIAKKYNSSILSKLENDGYAILSDNVNLYLEANTDNGIINSAIGFLNKYCGIDMLSPDDVYIPVISDLQIPKNTIVISNPAFKMRDVFNDISYNSDYTLWHSMTHMYKEPNEWGLTDHTFFKLLSPSVYFKSHPEYYSLIKGKRVASQLCLSNPQVEALLIKQLAGLIAKAPDKVYWSVSQEDNGTFCECPNCQKLYQQFGGYSGALLKIINDIAVKFPTKTIVTLAYHQSLQPPKSSIKPISNVMICFAPIEAFHQSSYTESTDDKIYANYLTAWSKIAHKLMIWDYVENYSNMLQPYPTFFTFQKNLQFFKKMGVTSVYEEGMNKPGGNLKELSTYLLAKLLWNPNLDADSLMNRFCSEYYGKAAPFVMSYITELRNNIKENNDKLRFWGGTSQYLNAKYLNGYDDILQKAATAVSGQPTYLNRIDILRLGINVLLYKKNISSSSVQSRSVKSGQQSSAESDLKQKILNTAIKNNIDWIQQNGKWVRISQIL